MTFTTIDDFYVSDKDITDHNPSCTNDTSISLEQERASRYYGCGLVWEACQRLELPMNVACTAQVLFHRFYCKRRMQEYDVRIMSTSAFWLACKLEEVLECDDDSCLRLRDVLMMFYDCVLRRQEGGKRDEPYLLDLYSGYYSEFKERVIKGEREMLRCFGFVTHVEHAHPFVLTLGAQLGLASHKNILQSACSIVNDSLRTTLCVQVKAECVACSALFLAAQKHGHGLPHGWWDGCDVNWETLKMCCRTIASLFDGKDIRKETNTIILKTSSLSERMIFDRNNAIRISSKVCCVDHVMQKESG